MINFKKVKSYCKDNISLIENYANAVSDKEHMWHCHHRRELETSRKELIEKNEYYNRPARELIFLTHSEHSILHNKGKHHTEEAKRKMAEAKKGKHLSEGTKRKMSIANKGKIRSEEAKRKMSEAQKGKKMSEEAKQKLSDAFKALLWYNNGIISVRAKSCPEGFVKGRLKKLVHYKNGQVLV